MRTIKEAGKVYTLNDEGTIVEARYESLEENPLKIGDRTEVEGKTGHLRAVTSTVYGDVYAVEFDDGSYTEILQDKIKRSNADVKLASHNREINVRALDVPEIKEYFAAYQELPSITSSEILIKENEAEAVKLRARALIRQAGLSYQDQIDLNNIIVETDADISYLSEIKHTAALTDNEVYRKVNDRRYRLAEEVGSYAPIMGSAGKDDASWLENVMDDAVLTEVTDADLAATATAIVGGLSNDQLRDNETVAMAIGYSIDSLSMTDPEQTRKLAMYVDSARIDKLAKPEVKTASVDPDLDSFDTSALFI